MKFQTCCGLAFIIFALTSVHGRGDVRNDCVCGQANLKNQGRIVNGVATHKNKYPWMAAMFLLDKHLCGGAIISTKNILTAGHCYFYIPQPYQSTWVLGMHDSHDRDGQVFRIDHYEFHPRFYNFTQYDDYDMCLVKLRGTISFNFAIKPVCFNLPGDSYIGLKATVAGWGRLHEKSEEQATVLMETKVQVQTEPYCKEAVKRIMKFNRLSMICAFTKNTDACQGDSGGPLFIETHPNRYEIIGVVSFGDGCARDFPGIYGNLENPETQRWMKNYIFESNADICTDPVRKITSKWFRDFY